MALAHSSPPTPRLSSGACTCRTVVQGRWGLGDQVRGRELGAQPLLWVPQTPWSCVLRAWLDCNTKWEAAASCATGETGRYTGMQGEEPPKRGSGRAWPAASPCSPSPSPCLQTRGGPGCGCPGAEPHAPWALAADPPAFRRGRPSWLPSQARCSHCMCTRPGPQQSPPGWSKAGSS